MSGLEKDSKKTKFLDLRIGDLFIAHGTVWVRTDYSVGTCISPNRSGSCNFTTDPEDEYVQAIDGQEAEKLLLKHFANKE